MWVWKEDSRQRILPACQGLPDHGHDRPTSRHLGWRVELLERDSSRMPSTHGLVERLVVEVNVRIGIPAPFLKEVEGYGLDSSVLECLK